MIDQVAGAEPGERVSGYRRAAWISRDAVWPMRHGRSSDFRTKGGALSLQLRDIHALHPLARPLRLAEKREAGFDAGVIHETAHRQTTGEFGPPMPFDKGGDDLLQRHAVQRIAGMGNGRDLDHAGAYPAIGQKVIPPAWDSEHA